MQTSARLLGGLRADAVQAAAAARGVEVSPLSRYYRGTPGPEGLLLGFAAVEPAAIRRGVADLAAALEV